jgi:type I restriction enzyme M protein
VDLEAVSNDLQSLESNIADTDKTISEFCDELNIKAPF